MTKRQENQMRFGKLAAQRRYALRKNPTKAEVLFRSILKKYNIPHTFQKMIFAPRNFYILDFRIRTSKRRGVIIEIDGSVHDPEYDKKRDSIILSQREYRSWRILRIKNEEVYSGGAEKTVLKVFGGIIKKIKRGEEKRRRKMEKKLRAPNAHGTSPIQVQRPAIKN